MALNLGTIFDYADRGMFGTLTAYISHGFFVDADIQTGTLYRPLCLITLDPRPIALTAL